MLLVLVGQAVLACPPYAGVERRRRAPNRRFARRGSLGPLHLWRDP
jgi:hypothetical protein